jgi:hypothetical protein
MKEKLKLIKNGVTNGGTNATMTTTRQLVKPSQFLLQIAKEFKERIFEIKVNLQDVHKYRKKYSRSMKKKHFSKLKNAYIYFIVNTKKLYKLYNDAINNSRTLSGGKSKSSKIKGSGLFYSNNDKAFNHIQRFLQLSYEMLSNPIVLESKYKILEKFVTVLDNIHKFNEVLKAMFVKINQGSIVKTLPSVPKLNSITSRTTKLATTKPATTKLATTKLATINPQPATTKLATINPQPATIKPATIKTATIKPATIKPATIKPATIKPQPVTRQSLNVLPRPTPSNPVVQSVACPRCNKKYNLIRTDDKDILFYCTNCREIIKSTYNNYNNTQVPTKRTIAKKQPQVLFKTNNYSGCMSKCRNQCSRTNLSPIKEH